MVDANCEVYETEHLYVAGGSVVPVSGATMLTLICWRCAWRIS
ncbi:MAG: GMC oxidoreductase [Gammaproteobacteria bacterium]|jgi:hypothetical protein